METVPIEAVMVEVPAFTAVAMPLALTVATAGALEVQVTEPEMLPLLLSEKVPVAVKVVALPRASDIVKGEIVMPVKLAAVTVITSLVEMVPYPIPLLKEAVTLVVPTAAAVTTPGLTALAMAGAADVQLIKLETSELVPFE